MFHPTRIAAATTKIMKDLEDIDLYGSSKLYLCAYDEFLIPAEFHDGKYPCCEKRVDLKEVIDIIRANFKRPCIIRHNMLVDWFPCGANNPKNKLEIEEYCIDVCLVYM